MVFCRRAKHLFENMLEHMREMLEDDELRLDGACAIQRRFSVFAVLQFREFVFRFCADLFEQ